MGVQLTVRSPTPPEVLDSALRTPDFAFDEARIDIGREAVFDAVTMRDVPRGQAAASDERPAFAKPPG